LVVALLSKLKAAVNRALEGHARALYRLGLRPDHMTVMGLAWALLASLAYWKWASFWPYLALSAPALVLLSGYSDVMDGLLARLFGLESRRGAMLDSVLDRYADLAIIVGIWAGGLCSPLSALLALSGSLLVSYMRARAEGLGVEMSGVGLAERAERLLIIMSASWLALIWPRSLEIGMMLLAALTHLTGAQRAVYALLALRTSSSASSSRA